MKPALILVFVAATAAFFMPSAAAHYWQADYSTADEGLLIDGHDHDDYIRATYYPDRVNGFAGFDVLLGLGGPDVLNGGPDGDWVEGNSGADDILGGQGADSLYGGNENDVLKGGDGPDHLDCGAGANDSAWGGLGDDTFANCDGNAVE